MDKDRPGIVFFLPYWDKENSTRDDQLGFMMGQMADDDACEEIGGIAYGNSQYFYSDKSPKDFIKNILAKQRPRWAVGVENAATLLLPCHRQRKILVNPTVTLNDLNWVTPETIRDTWAFFSADYEKDYEMCQRVYKNVAFYPAQPRLSIGDLSAMIKAIINE